MIDDSRSRRILLSILTAVLLAWPATQALAQPELAICRDAGFWQTHAGSEKGAPNIVQALIEEAGGCIEICGEVIENTETDDADSALEGLCVSPKSGPQIQLARHALAAAMSCVISTGGPDCLDGSGYCNEACADGVYDLDDKLCLAYLSCTTRGGSLDFSSLGCWLGFCSIAGTPCGTGGVATCPAGETCVPFPGNCNSAPLLNEDLDLDFDPTPSSSSSKACNGANKTPCTIVGPKEEVCDDGNTSEGPESCPTTTTTTTTTTTSTTTSTTLLPRSCEGYCNQDGVIPPGSGNSCYCDFSSCSYGDGCADRDTWCPDVCTVRSCAGYCGQVDVVPPGGGEDCYCDSLSCSVNDGCADRDTECPDVCTPTTTLPPP